MVETCISFSRKPKKHWPTAYNYIRQSQISRSCSCLCRTHARVRQPKSGDNITPHPFWPNQLENIGHTPGYPKEDFRHQSRILIDNSIITWITMIITIIIAIFRRWWRILTDNCNFSRLRRAKINFNNCNNHTFFANNHSIIHPPETKGRQPEGGAARLICPDSLLKNTRS